MIRRFLIGDAHNWMQEFKRQSSAKKVLSNRMTVRRAPDEALQLLPAASEVDLLVCFVNGVQPGLAEGIGRLLYDARVRKMLILSHQRLEWGKDWLHNFQTAPLSAKRSGNVLVPTSDQLMREERLEIREMDYYRSVDMRMLIDELLSNREVA